MSDLEEKKKRRINNIIGFGGLLGVIILLFYLQIWYYNSDGFMDEKIQSFEESTTCWELLIINLKGGATFMDNSFLYMWLDKENLERIETVVTEKGKTLCLKLYEINERVPIFDGNKIHFDWLTCDELNDMKYEFPESYHSEIDDAYYTKQCGR